MPLKMYQPKEKSIKNIIAIAAGKGGVGKSFVTACLAIALKQKGFSVGVLDTDIYGPSLRKMLPEDRLPKQEGKYFIPALSCGIELMSIAYFRKPYEATAVRAPIATAMIKQFLHQVVWSDLDFLLIDYPPGTGDIQLTLGQEAKLTGALMVTTPQEVAMLDVRKAMHLFEQIKIPIIGIIENMSHFNGQYIFGKGGGKRLSEEMQVPLLAKVPILPKLSEKADRGFDLEPVAIFQQLAEALIRNLNTEKAAIKEFKVLEKNKLFIEWNDGKKSTYCFSDLQKRCPCITCIDEQKTNRVDKNLTVKNIFSVGRYGLRFEFSSGCSSGIYDFEMLREIG